MSSIPHRAKVLLTVPNGDAWTHKLVTRAVIACLQDRRYEVVYQDPTHRPYEHNLNRCAQEMIDQGCSYWLSLDDDNPPTRNPLDLVELDLDLVGLPTPVWHSAVRGDRPYYFNALDWDEEGEGWKPHVPRSASGLEEVDAIGTGCFLASRRVIERVWRKHPFERPTDARGFVLRGHDYEFSRYVKLEGFRVWAHYGYPCRHFCEVDLLEVIESFLALKRREVTDA